METFRSGFVTIIGRPNSGKSTLLNCLVGTKVAITSAKSQTTRNIIRGVVNLENAQVVFVDTPGVHKPKHRLGELMVGSAVRTLKEVDLILYLVDAAAEIGAGEQFIWETLMKVNTPVFLGLNKIDLVNKEKIASCIQTLTSASDFQEVIPLSALKRGNIDTLLDLVVRYLPEGPKYYPEGMITDRPEEFIVAELIREKVLSMTEDEVPHSTAVQVDLMEERDGLIYVAASVIVERETQKAIVIGKNGQKLKRIGSAARREIESILGSRIFLELWVRVKKEWRKNEGSLRQLGYVRKE